MTECVWVGAVEHTPPGWAGVESVEQLLASSIQAKRIVIDDRAATLREADFLRIFQHSPLAKIERAVGPWRAGIGRTDSAWPIASTAPIDTPVKVDSTFTVDWVPVTSGYDELAAIASLAHVSDSQLMGISFEVRIVDPELRMMWIDSLRHAGAKPQAINADLFIEVDSESSPISQGPLKTGTPPRLRVSLRPDPWNASHSEEMLAIGSSHPTEITASILDSPQLVIQRIAKTLKRDPS